LADALYDVAPWTLASSSGFRNRLEGWISGPQLHNLVHVWVGGSMGPMSSPNDPVFFLHHCFVDKLWADWQRLHTGAGYLPVSGAAPGHNLGDAMQPWAGRGETITPASRLDHHALGYAYDTEPECGLPTLKFRDDIPTLKFADDFPTLKFADDFPTLKFRDDLPTLKFLDDPPTLKFVDDPGTLKFIDDGGTLKAIDDVKQPVLDVQDPGGKFQTDPIGQPTNPLIGQAAPFVLSTPHHSMAWAQDQPGAFQSSVAQVESELTQFAAAIAEREEAQRNGSLPAAAADELDQLRREYESLLAEYQQLVQGAGVGSGGAG
jgi:Common central domain of tyrosinase